MNLYHLSFKNIEIEMKTYLFLDSTNKRFEQQFVVKNARAKLTLSKLPFSNTKKLESIIGMALYNHVQTWQIE